MIVSSLKDGQFEAECLILLTKILSDGNTILSDLIAQAFCLLFSADALMTLPFQCVPGKRQTSRRTVEVCVGIAWPGHDDKMVMHFCSFLFITVVPKGSILQCQSRNSQ